ncbi:hypothetical protein E0W68_11480 [Flavobacterium salilacus subsp. salilacus]|uniref:hypothetical protein n=1 Tax=Flavobacterium TaxID=237 RepID=UPI0013C29EBE|nr:MULTISPECIES: hypothetical protein [Flavobacterium]KAF2516829.1 hypothetical protein E0W68_11480 [Flavobacterium salilacus subsp. salilacus]MBE1615812.1 hypothetical protein [Flavobacterium sp. SaA2.13]
MVITEWGGLRKTMLLEYEMTTDFASRYNNGDVDFVDFDGYLYVNILNADSGFPCNDSPGGGSGIPISGGAGDSSGGSGSGGSSGGGGGGGSNGNGNPHNEFFLMHLYAQLEMSLSYSAENAENNGGGNDGGGDDDEEWIEVSRSPRYFSVPPDDDTTNPCGEGEEIGIFNPVQIINDAQLCNDLKAKSQDPNFTALMNGLKTKAGTQNFESAYTMYQTPGQGLNFSSEFTGSANVANGGEVSLQIQQSSTQTPINSIGFIHCHLDNGVTYKVFSLQDIIALAQIAQTSTRPTSELALYVTTASGTFALKITNKAALVNMLPQLTDNYTHNLNVREFDRYVKKGKPVNEQVKGLLELMNHRFPNMMNLYQQDANGDWKKLELNQFGTGINSTNC